MFITGPGGSGKSFIVQRLKEHFGDKLALTASTGISALNIQGVTIHTWARLKTGSQPAETIAKSIARNKEAKKTILSCTYLVLDEISMLPDFLFDLLNEVLQLVRNNQAPFGGIQMILVGDFLQLPPIMRNGEDFCFKSSTWRFANIKTVLLKGSHRHLYDEEYSKLLLDLRLGLNTDRHYVTLQKRLVSVLPEPSLATQKQLVYLTPLNKESLEINTKFFNSLDAGLNVFKATYEGEEKYIDIFKGTYESLEDLRLKVGAKVMLTTNLNVRNGLVNGAVGEVLSFDRISYFPTVAFTNVKEPVEINPLEWKVEEPETNRKLFSFYQLPLKQAWSVSIHKSQGCTLPAACISLGNCFEAGQAYVALSRVRSFKDLYLMPFSKSCFKTNKEVVAWYNELAE